MTYRLEWRCSIGRLIFLIKHVTDSHQGHRSSITIRDVINKNFRTMSNLEELFPQQWKYIFLYPIFFISCKWRKRRKEIKMRRITCGLNYFCSDLIQLLMDSKISLLQCNSDFSYWIQMRPYLPNHYLHDRWGGNNCSLPTTFFDQQIDSFHFSLYSSF